MFSIPNLNQTADNLLYISGACLTSGMLRELRTNKELGVTSCLRSNLQATSYVVLTSCLLKLYYTNRS